MASGAGAARPLGIDSELMLMSCQSLLITMFGESNWERWSNIREQHRPSDFQTCITWMLDIVEEQMQLQDTGEADIQYESPAVRDVDEYYCGDEDAPDLRTEMLARNDADDDVQFLFPSATSGMKVEDGDCVESEAVSNVQARHRHGALVSEADGGRGSDVPSVSAGGEQGEVLHLTHLHAQSQFMCQVCRVSLSDLDIVSQHVAIRHPLAAALSISCTCCQQTFPSTDTYVTYHAQKTVSEVSGGGPGAKRGHRSVCGQCAKSFCSAQSLDEHVRYKHDKAEPKYQCRGCGKRFRYATHMYSHRKKCAAAASSLMDTHYTT